MPEKVVFITGGAGGLGYAVAEQFARAGHGVCIGDIDEARGSEAERDLQAISTEAFFQSCDVTKAADLEGARDAVLERWGRVDLVVNNAGIVGRIGPLEVVSEDDWKRTLDINLMGVVRGCRTFIPVLKAGGGAGTWSMWHHPPPS